MERKADGWYVSIQTEIEYAIAAHHGDSIGIDMGVKWFATFPEGTFIEPSAPLKKNLKKLKFKERRLSRMTKFGSNWRKQKQRIAHLHQRVANIRQGLH